MVHSLKVFLRLRLDPYEEAEEGQVYLSQGRIDGAQ